MLVMNLGYRFAFNASQQWGATDTGSVYYKDWYNQWKINFTTGKIYYYIIWENHRNSKNFVIQCNKDYVYIYYIFDNKLDFIKLDYPEITGNNYSACILYNRKKCDYLCIVNENTNIVFYDLLNNNLSSVVKINDNALINICEYNDKYLIVLSKNHYLTPVKKVQ